MRVKGLELRVWGLRIKVWGLPETPRVLMERKTETTWFRVYGLGL